jgi:peptidoglycan/xylan/chitin deacetylase (PgdA/CDA1 family)
MEGRIGGTKSKTARQRIRRAILLPSRYGFSSTKFMENLERMVALLKRHGVVGTFPITAKVLERHHELAGILYGMEVAVHGLKHRDFTGLETNHQIAAMKEAIEIFRSVKLQVNGFRAPYLRWSDSMMEAVSGAGFLYDSSVPSGWSCGSEFDLLAGMIKALQSYLVGGTANRLPIMRGRLVEMPVAIPDDEILLDRLGITSPERLSRALNAMTNAAMQSGGHLVLQLHPERFSFFGRALDDMLKRVLAEGVWVAPLKEVAMWWIEKRSGEHSWPEEAPCALTVSGDIDAVTLGDFVARRLGR